MGTNQHHRHYAGSSLSRLLSPELLGGINELAAVGGTQRQCIGTQIPCRAGTYIPTAPGLFVAVFLALSYQNAQALPSLHMSRRTISLLMFHQ